jgi:hypothetical protein
MKSDKLSETSNELGTDEKLKKKSKLTHKDPQNIGETPVTQRLVSELVQRDIELIFERHKRGVNIPIESVRESFSRFSHLYTCQHPTEKDFVKNILSSIVYWIQDKNISVECGVDLFREIIERYEVDRSTARTAELQKMILLPSNSYSYEFKDVCLVEWVDIALHTVGLFNNFDLLKVCLEYRASLNEAILCDFVNSGNREAVELILKQRKFDLTLIHDQIRLCPLAMLKLLNRHGLGFNNKFGNLLLQDAVGDFDGQKVMFLVDKKAPLKPSDETFYHGVYPHEQIFLAKPSPYKIELLLDDTKLLPWMKILNADKKCISRSKSLKLINDKCKVIKKELKQILFCKTEVLSNENGCFELSSEKHHKSLFPESMLTEKWEVPESITKASEGVTSLYPLAKWQATVIPFMSQTTTDPKTDDLKLDILGLDKIMYQMKDKKINSYDIRSQSGFSGSGRIELDIKDQNLKFFSNNNEERLWWKLRHNMTIAQLFTWKFCQNGERILILPGSYDCVYLISNLHREWIKWSFFEDKERKTRIKIYCIRSCMDFKESPFQEKIDTHVLIMDTNVGRVYMTIKQSFIYRWIYPFSYTMDGTKDLEESLDGQRDLKLDL